MINSAAARSRVRSPTRTYQSHTAVHHCGDQVAFQENGPTYVDPSSRRIQTVSGRYAATPRSKSIAMFLAFDRPTKVATTRFGSTFHTPTLGRSTITVARTLSAASKTGGRASKEAIHTTTCDHSLCARKKVIHTFRAEMITENRVLTENRGAGSFFDFFFLKKNVILVI